MMSVDQADHPPAQRLLCAIPELADEHQPGLSLDERNHAVFSARSHHRVGLPVPDHLSGLHLRWPLRDHPFTRESAAAVVGAVALAAPLPGPAQVRVERPALLLIPPDVAVDRLVANGEQPLPGEVSRDLLGAPLPAEQPVYLREVRGREALVAAGAGAP